ncbi:MAG TPA: AraC family transcriptional regulator [Aliidongia sp.]|uniref:AraC family transcriptional regulator n=1 Tax=Aliidongia sp. TaxID=1914230 RepID=UPI002DDDBBB3|nr:AraC family transcriptional regulator [Aliidongia sp.]HEV2674839.1 AraC family transcriptional regulator [Aliidongia sp.]
MSAITELLASGPGWSVRNIVCTAGPGDRPFEERHDAVCIGMVLGGTFQYRTQQGRATLAPGALLLGNAGACFECGHDHAAGDHCLSFHFEPGLFDAIVAAVPGVRRADFRHPRLSPSSALLPFVAAAEAAADDPAALEEVALGLAGAVAATLADSPTRSPGRRDERRIGEVLRLLEVTIDETFPLIDLAARVAMSPYHFLRTFRAVVGVTPHQFVLGERLRRAAVRLRRSGEPVSAIAYDAGFGDLSTFNRRFRRVMGVSPTEYRRNTPG